MSSVLFPITTYTCDLSGESALPHRARSVALGVFDGVHLGHRAVILQAAGAFTPQGERLTTAVLTFTQPPVALNKAEAWELMSDEQKELAFRGLGVEEWIQTDFEQLRDYSPERFVREILHERLHAKRVSCGYNYHFGKNGAGDASLLRALCAEVGIEVVVAEAVEVDGQPVSASRIRRLIEQGDMPRASKLLGRPFTLDLEVMPGHHLGRKLGTPTINQPLPPEYVQPRFGVYLSACLVEGKTYFGVTNVGCRPTVNPTTPLAETWILDYQGDLYGKKVPVSLIRFMRPEMKFESVDAMRLQILQDGQNARDMVNKGDGVRAVLFDFDDTLQNRPLSLIAYIEWFFERHFSDLPPTISKARQQEMAERNRGGYVHYVDYFQSLIDSWQWVNSPSAMELYHEMMYEFPRYTSLFPEAIEVLCELKARGYRLGIVTNGPTLTQNRKVDISGIRSLFDVVVVSGDEGVHKPDREIFRRAASRLGLDSTHCLVVGDHPVNDIEGALGAKMQAVYINAFGENAAYAQPEGVRCITDLYGLLPLLPPLSPDLSAKDEDDASI